MNISGRCLWMSCCPGLFLHLAAKKWEEREVLLSPCPLFSVHREKRREHILFYLCTERPGAGFSLVASLVSRPTFIKRITWHSWETGLWMLLFSVAFGLSQPRRLEEAQPQICSVMFGVLLWHQQMARAVLSSRLCVFHPKCPGYCCCLFFLLHAVTGIIWFSWLSFPCDF